MIFILVKREETRKAMVLLGIVISFTLCNVPRVILNIEEFGVMSLSYYKLLYSETQDDDINERQQIEKPCFKANFWAYILKTISKLLLTIHASSCCFVYCVMCPIFRDEITKKFKAIFKFVSKIVCCKN